MPVDLVKSALQVFLAMAPQLLEVGLLRGVVGIDPAGKIQPGVFHWNFQSYQAACSQPLLQDPANLINGFLLGGGRGANLGQTEGLRGELPRGLGPDHDQVGGRNAQRD